jgi:4a-hydroxytetrahydrobiopterin dehydratase
VLGCNPRIQKKFNGGLSTPFDITPRPRYNATSIRSPFRRKSKEKPPMPPIKATDDEIQIFLDEQLRWRVENAKLHREYKFANFVEAFGFMAQVALLAEQADHHPEWFNVYSRVVVGLTTHEAGGITARDVDLAQKMEVPAS